LADGVRGTEMHHQSKFRPNRSMRCGDRGPIVISRFFNIITIDHVGLQNYAPHFTHTSTLTVRKFWSAFYPLTVCTSAGPHFTRRRVTVRVSISGGGYQSALHTVISSLGQLVTG